MEIFPVASVPMKGKTSKEGSIIRKSSPGHLQYTHDAHVLLCISCRSLIDPSLLFTTFHYF
jgi:hypothetical protein